MDIQNAVKYLRWSNLWNSFQRLSIFEKHSILNVWQGSEKASEVYTIIEYDLAFREPCLTWTCKSQQNTSQPNLMHLVHFSLSLVLSCHRINFDLISLPLREKCPNTEFFPQSDWIQRFTTAGIYGPVRTNRSVHCNGLYNEQT